VAHLDCARRRNVCDGLTQIGARPIDGLARLRAHELQRHAQQIGTRARADCA
jgi:hypothetical protein